MIRILLHYVLPLVLPLAVYLGWMWILRHRAKAKGDEVPTVQNKSVFFAIVAGAVLTLVSLTVIAVVSGEDPGTGEYTSPRLEDGKVVPPTFK